jgi:hypothetical protein
MSTVAENPNISSVPRPSIAKQGSNSKLQVEDPAIVMMKNIMK